MIIGIGVDLVERQRVARLIDRYGERFARRVLTALEWPRYAKSAKPELFLANRFAAKEAFSKAMGTGFRTPVTLQKISVVQDRLGKPSLSFHQDLQTLLQARGVQCHHLTLSDEAGMACALVILEG